MIENVEMTRCNMMARSDGYYWTRIVYYYISSEKKNLLNFYALKD